MCEVTHMGKRNSKADSDEILQKGKRLRRNEILEAIDCKILAPRGEWCNFRLYPLSCIVVLNGRFGRKKGWSPQICVPVEKSSVRTWTSTPRRAARAPVSRRRRRCDVNFAGAESVPVQPGSVKASAPTRDRNIACSGGERRVDEGAGDASDIAMYLRLETAPAVWLPVLLLFAIGVQMMPAPSGTLECLSQPVHGLVYIYLSCSTLWFFGRAGPVDDLVHPLQFSTIDSSK